MSNRLQSEMNVVPYIDVTLVLLIIFMITTPFMISKTDITIPEYNNKEISSNEKKNHFFITYDKNNNLFLGDKKIILKDLFIEIKNNPKKDIFIIADENVIYGDLINLMNEIKNNTNRSNINLVTKNINE